MKLVLILLSPLICVGQRNPNTTSAIQHARMARIDTIVSMLKISADDKIADIGTGKGYNLVRLANYFPSTQYYTEDIDTTSLNRKNLQATINAFHSKLPVDSFIITYGTSTSTNLPRHYFSKVLMIAVLHEFDRRDLMLADIKSILQTGGQLFIEEPLVVTKRKKDKGCNNPYLTELELKAILAKNGISIEEEKLIGDIGIVQYRKIFRCVPKL